MLTALNDPVPDPAPDIPAPPAPVPVPAPVPEPDPAPAGAADDDVEIESDTSEARSLESEDIQHQPGDSGSDELAGFETPESRSPSPHQAAARPPIPTPCLLYTSPSPRDRG